MQRGFRMETPGRDSSKCFCDFESCFLCSRHLLKYIYNNIIYINKYIYIIHILSFTEWGFDTYPYITAKRWTKRTPIQKDMIDIAMEYNIIWNRSISLPNTGILCKCLFFYHIQCLTSYNYHIRAHYDPSFTNLVNLVLVASW